MLGETEFSTLKCKALYQCALVGKGDCDRFKTCIAKSKVKSILVIRGGYQICRSKIFLWKTFLFSVENP